MNANADFEFCVIFIWFQLTVYIFDDVNKINANSINYLGGNAGITQM